MGVVVDGCPAGLPLCEEDLQLELDRRRPGQSDLVTPRKAADRCEILSGVFQGRTLGTPIALGDGILFLTYATLRSNRGDRGTRLRQLIEWMGESIQQGIEAQLRLLHILIQNQT